MIDFSEQKVLKIKKRDGSELDLVLRHIPYKQAPDHIKSLKALHRRYELFVRRDSDVELLAETQNLIESGSDNKELKEKVKSLEKTLAVPIPEALNHYEYVTQSIAAQVEVFNEPDFEDFTGNQLTSILEALGELSKPKEGEKKSG